MYIQHFLRGEPGVYYEDLYPLVSFLPKYANMHGDMLPLWHVSNNLSWNKHTFGLPDNVSATDSLGYRQEPSPTSHLHGDTSCDDKSEMSWFRSLSKNLGMGRPSRRDPEKALGGIHCEFSLRPARNPPKVSISDYIPLLRCFKWLFRVIMRREHPKGEDAAWRKRKKLDTVESNVPLEILLVLSGLVCFTLCCILYSHSISRYTSCASKYVFEHSMALTGYRRFDKEALHERSHCRKYVRLREHASGKFV